MSTVNDIKKNTNAEKINSKKEGLDNHNSKSSLIKDTLINAALSFFDKDTKNSDMLNTDNVIEILESDYKDTNSLYNQYNDNLNEDSNVSSKFTDKNSSNKNTNIDKINTKKNKVSYDNFVNNTSNTNKYYRPPKNKTNDRIKTLDEIINTLKNDYRKLSELYDSFEKMKFSSSMSTMKSNVILNNFEKEAFSKLKNLNSINKLVNSNIELKNTLNEIFKTDDISSQCEMYAYNIYSFIKMFHYSQNTINKTDSEKKVSSSTSNNNSNKNNFKFKKEQFDSLKSIRDNKIKSLQYKSSDNITYEEASNLNLLNKERSVMEGYKSNIRLNIINKNRTQDLSDKIRDSKKSLSGSIFSAQVNSSNDLNDLANLISTNNKK